MTSEVAELRNTIEGHKGNIALMDALERLSTNPDWKLIVDHLYLAQEPVRISEAMADPNLMVHRPRLLERITSVGDFKLFLKTVVQQGTFSKEQIVADEELLRVAVLRSENPEAFPTNEDEYIGD